MKRIRSILGSFRTKVTITLVLALFLVMSLSDFLIYQFSLNMQFSQLREKLMMIAQTAALMIDTDLLSKVPLSREGVNSEAYQAIVQKLKKIKEVNTPLKYIYIMTKTNQEGIWQFVVDPDPENRGRKSNIVTSYPGDKYNALRFPEMLKAFSGTSADNKIEFDEWGVTLSGYAPIRDKYGEAVAILGVDMEAKDVYQTQKEVHRRAMFVLLVGVLTSVVLGFTISSRLAARIEKLAKATRHIAAEDLEYKVEMGGNDEISELAKSFNQMASSLADSRNKLHDYFYRVVQSLVRILEAKDPYTQGHSERIAEYAQKIALHMGFSPEKAETVRKAAELHDIGKLAINENILNKKGKLTDEEWKIIREHPILAEEVLKPVLLDEEMLVMIRSHHERYDGEGYPDKIKGDNINLFAQIIAVADAYDAMISPRAYREPMSKEAAISELKVNSGTQFNTQVVKAFLKMMEEEYSASQGKT